MRNKRETNLKYGTCAQFEAELRHLNIKKYANVRIYWPLNAEMLPQNALFTSAELYKQFSN